MIENNNGLTLENYLSSSQSAILKSVNKEKYIFDYDNFDFIHEIKDDGDVVGFITVENDDLNKRFIINECYILPDKRGNNLFFKNYCDIINNTEKEVFIRKPNKNLINVLLHNDCI